MQKDKKNQGGIVNNFYGNVNKVINNYGTIDDYSTVIAPSGEDRRATSPTETGEDDRLYTEAAQKYWLRLQTSGFVDNDYRLMPGTTRKQAMLIAEAFAEKLEIKAKWKTFQQVWGICNLAQEKWEKLEEGITIPRQNEINQIFED